MPNWPRYAIMPEHKALSRTHFDYKDGVLKFLGYTTGINGQNQWNRMKSLRYAYEGKLPRVQSDDYIAEFGDPQSAERLMKMANSLATFAKNAAKKKGQANEQAISQWQDDLAWLKETYYDQNRKELKEIGFSWPENWV